jgi:hypothetical protein
VQGDEGEEFREAKEVKEKRKKRRIKEERRTKEIFLKTFSLVLLSSLVLRFKKSLPELPDLL